MLFEDCIQGLVPGYVYQADGNLSRNTRCDNHIEIIDFGEKEYHVEQVRVVKNKVPGFAGVFGWFLPYRAVEVGEG